MFNLNGVWVEASSVRSILAGDAVVHISLDNGATYDIPGEVGVDISATAEKMAHAVASAKVTGYVPPQPLGTVDSFLADGAEQVWDLSPEARERRLVLGQTDGWADPTVHMTETEKDEFANKWFSDGWRSALKEAKLQLLNGTVEMFLDETLAQEERSPEGFDQPTLNGFDSIEVEGHEPQSHTLDHFAEMVDKVIGSIPNSEKKDFPDIDLDFEDERRDVVSLPAHLQPDIVRPVADSGEPELENMNKTKPINEGKVTLEYEEWQGGLDDAYERGRKDGTTDKRQTTERWLKTATSEILVELGVNAPNNYTFAKALLPRLGFEVSA